MAQEAILIAAFVVSAATLVTTTIFALRSSSATSTSEWRDAMQGRLEIMEDELERKEAALVRCQQVTADLRKEVSRLERRQTELLLRLARLENGDK